MRLTPGKFLSKTKSAVIRLLSQKINKIEYSLKTNFRPFLTRPSRSLAHFVTVFIISSLVLVNFFGVQTNVAGSGNSSFLALDTYASSVSEDEVTASLAFYTAQPVLPEVVEDTYGKKVTAITLAGTNVISNYSPVNTQGQGWKADIIQHTVSKGETLSGIAAKYKVSTSTIYWLNELSDAHSIKVGQVIGIPPISGVIHTVKAGETFEGVAKKYSADLSDIISYNDLSNEKLSPGDKIIVPGASKSIPAPAAPKPSLAGGAGGRFGSSIPTWGRGLFSYPTSGSGYNGYHWWAIDIPGNTGQSIWASDSGRIVQAKAGCPNGYNKGCNGGLGNFIRIDHGNGFQTVYAHMTSLALTGGFVSKGQVVGYMGCSGRSYGRNNCGTHLHFEIIKNGARQNPYWYL